MSTTTGITAAQLSEMPADGKRYELVSGELRMMSPSGWKHGKVVGRLHTRLGHHVEQHELGTVFGAETGFLVARDPDTVRAPDIAFIAQGNLPATEPDEAYWPGAPDLAVEVLSPHDKTGEVNEQVQTWLAAGCRMVWVVNPKLKTIAAHQSATDIRLHTVNDQIDGGNVVAGFNCAVSDIFGQS